MWESTVNAPPGFPLALGRNDEVRGIVTSAGMGIQVFQSSDLGLSLRLESGADGVDQPGNEA